MKIFKTLLVAATFTALLSCSETNHPHIDNEAQLQNQTRGEEGKDEEGEVGMSAIITDNRESLDIPPINLVPDEADTDTIPTDGLPNDSIPNDSTRKRIKK